MFICDRSLVVFAISSLSIGNTCKRLFNPGENKNQNKNERNKKKVYMLLHINVCIAGD